jgi:hypothetical protein
MVCDGSTELILPSHLTLRFIVLLLRLLLNHVQTFVFITI